MANEYEEKSLANEYDNKSMMHECDIKCDDIKSIVCIIDYHLKTFYYNYVNVRGDMNTQAGSIKCQNYLYSYDKCQMTNDNSPFNHSLPINDPLHDTKCNGGLKCDEMNYTPPITFIT